MTKKESRFPRQLLLHCSNTVHPWTYAPKKRKAAALDGIIMSARSLWYRSLRSTYPPETGGSPSASVNNFSYKFLNIIGFNQFLARLRALCGL